MTEKNHKQHHVRIINQFSKQAIPFTELPQHQDSIQRLIEMSKVTGEDRVLDVACGPGLVACEFARIAKHVTGIDLTEKMIEQAAKRQTEHSLDNLSWDIGSATTLPYAAHSFSVVVTRYSFHHFLDPEAVLNEMIRVCKPGGKVLVADVALSSDNVSAYNRMEKLRDPSHTEALSYDTWEKLLGNSGLQNLQHSNYKVQMELEKLLKASFPNPGNEDKIRDIIRNDINTNTLGVDAHLAENEIHFSYPISIFVGTKIS